jgi:hypothetical protein
MNAVQPLRTIGGHGLRHQLEDSSIAAMTQKLPAVNGHGDTCYMCEVLCFVRMGFGRVLKMSDMP